jgi:hypothetical protein
VEHCQKETRAMAIHRRMILLAILALLKLCLAPAVAQVSTPDLVAQSKTEGRVTWSTTVSIPESKQFMDMFEKQYPFIKVDLLRSGSGALVNRIVSEYAAKNYAADVLHGMSSPGGAGIGYPQGHQTRQQRFTAKNASNTKV